MKLILSPAKKMKLVDVALATTKPKLLEKSKKIHQLLLEMSLEERQVIYKSNQKIAIEASDYLTQMRFEHATSPAIYSYQGIQYQYLNAGYIEDRHIPYLRENVFILSGFYGILRAFDAIDLYRLEMQAKLEVDQQNLYQFFQQEVVQFLMQQEDIIINLASNEYGKLVEGKLDSKRMINIHFVEKQQDKYVSKGVYVKMARGAMARYIIENELIDPKDIQKFQELNYQYNIKLSDERNYVFERIK